MSVRKLLTDKESNFWKISRMSNKEMDEMISNKFYKMKVEYLDSLGDIEEETAITYIRMFMYNFLELEKAYDKDLYEFNIDEIRLAIKSVRTTSQTLKRALFILIKNYLEWAYEEGYRSTVNDIRLLQEEENLLDVDVKRLEKKYISMNRVLVVCKRGLENNESENVNSINYSDALLVLLIRSGFTFEEALDLNYEDIDYIEHQVNYYNKEKKYSKTIKLDERIIEYYNNATMECDGVGNISNNRAAMSVRARITKLIEASKIPATTKMKNFTDSQMIDDLDEIFEEKGFLKVEDVKAVKAHYEPLSKEATYSSLKNLYCKLRGIDVRRDTGLKRKSKALEEKKIAIKKLLEGIE